MRYGAACMVGMMRMSMRRRKALWAAAVTLMVATGSGRSSHAADAYICGPDKLVYVAVEDLERMKRTDECIAAYYGLKIEAKTTQLRTADTASSTVRPVVQTKTTPVALKPVVQDETVHDRHKTIVTSVLAARPAMAAPDTDFRNVRVINATSENDTWYRHQR